MGPAQTGGAAAPAPSGPVKPADQVRIVSIAQQQMFVPDGYYVWLWNGPQWGVYLGGIGLVAVVLAGVMFPLWPPFMRLGTWYLSIGVLGLIGLFFALAIFRCGGHGARRGLRSQAHLLRDHHLRRQARHLDLSRAVRRRRLLRLVQARVGVGRGAEEEVAQGEIGERRGQGVGQVQAATGACRRLGGRLGRVLAGSDACAGVVATNLHPRMHTRSTQRPARAASSGDMCTMACEWDRACRARCRAAIVSWLVTACANLDGAVDVRCPFRR